MPLPRLLHPVDVKIQQISRGATVYDEDAREPVQQAARAVTTTVPGQVKWSTTKGFTPVRGQNGEEAEGYVLFRRVDLAAEGITQLQLNDRLIQIGDLLTDVYVIKLAYEGHYTDQGGPTLVKAFFADRQPAKQRIG